MGIYNEIFYNYNIISKNDNNDYRRKSLEIQYNMFNKIFEFKNKYKKMRENKYNDVLCMHIRTGYGLNEVAFLSDEDINKFTNTALQKPNMKWILQTDNTELTKNIYYKYKDHFLYQPNFNVQHFLNEVSGENSLINLLSISQCSYYILTNQSTFGLLGLLMSGICLKVKDYNDCVTFVNSSIYHRFPLFYGNNYEYYFFNKKNCYIT